MPVGQTGGRPLTYASVAARRFTVEDERSVSRKELAQAAREAEKALNLRPSLRLVLHELTSVWGERELDGKLMVWPSNDYLIDRTGLSERSIRYALAELVELQVIRPRESANGKRFAVRDRSGAIVDAYGFDLAPLYARRGEFVAVVAEIKRQRDAQGRLFDEITICRRAAEEALSALLTHFPGHPSDDLAREIDALKQKTPRRGFIGPLEPVVGLWKDLRRRSEERFYKAGCGGKDGRHEETDKGSLSEPCSKRLSGDVPAERPGLTIGVVLEACPALAYFERRIRTVEDLVAAGRFFRSAIGAHESAWTEAAAAVGPVVAAGAVCYVLQLHEDDVAAGINRIKNPGGYFRALVRMISEGRFDLDAELHALRRKRMA
jgi:replication initiation protein RepC